MNDAQLEITKKIIAATFKDITVRGSLINDTGIY